MEEWSLGGSNNNKAKGNINHENYPLNYHENYPLYGICLEHSTHQPRTKGIIWIITVNCLRKHVSLFIGAEYFFGMFMVNHIIAYE